MNIKLSQSDFCLASSETLRLSGAAGVRVEALSGTVWVTQDRDQRDVVLRRGEALTLDRDGPAIVQAFEASQVRLLPPSPAPRIQVSIDWAARIAGALRRALPRAAAA